jgi:hypothetical protein
MTVTRSLYFTNNDVSFTSSAIESILEIKTTHEDLGANGVTLWFEHTGRNFGALELISSFHSYAHMGELTKQFRNLSESKTLRSRPPSESVQLTSSWNCDIEWLFDRKWTELDEDELEQISIFVEYPVNVRAELKPLSAEKFDVIDALKPLAEVVAAQGGFAGLRNITAGSLPGGDELTNYTSVFDLFFKDWPAYERTLGSLSSANILTDLVRRSSGIPFIGTSRIKTRLDIEGHFA